MGSYLTRKDQSQKKNQLVQDFFNEFQKEIMKGSKKQGNQALIKKLKNVTDKNSSDFIKELYSITYGLKSRISQLESQSKQLQEKLKNQNSEDTVQKVIKFGNQVKSDMNRLLKQTYLKNSEKFSQNHKLKLFQKDLNFQLSQMDTDQCLNYIEKSFSFLQENLTLELTKHSQKIPQIPKKQQENHYKQEKVMNNVLIQNKQCAKIQLYYKWILEKINVEGFMENLFKQPKGQQFNKIYECNNYTFKKTDIIEETNNNNWDSMFIYIEEILTFLIQIIQSGSGEKWEEKQQYLSSGWNIAEQQEENIRQQSRGQRKYQREEISKTQYEEKSLEQFMNVKKQK